jgi:conjugal transfer pilus assembly protein TraB
MKKIIDFALKPLSTLNPQQKQSYIYYGCISGAVILVFTVIWNLAFASSGPRTTRGAAPTEKVLTGASRLNPQDAWNERMNNQFDIQEKEMAELKKMVKQLTDKKKEDKEERGLYLNPSPESGALLSGQPIGNPITSNSSRVLDVSLGVSNSSSTVSPQSDLKGSNPADTIKRFRSKGISKQQIALHNSKIGKSLDTVDNTIPPGSFAQGVLLSGVDASTSTSASANPEPVLIELTDSGDLSRYFTSTVNGCRVTASSYGVLSKERVMMRLEKLSCTTDC